MNEPCALCREQLTKSRYEPPHPKLRVIKTGPDIGHMFGGGYETTYRCDECGETIIHSTDRYDLGWR